MIIIVFRSYDNYLKNTAKTKDWHATSSRAERFALIFECEMLSLYNGWAVVCPEQSCLPFLENADRNIIVQEQLVYTNALNKDEYYQHLATITLQEQQYTDDHALGLLWRNDLSQKVQKFKMWKIKPPEKNEVINIEERLKPFKPLELKDTQWQYHYPDEKRTDFMKQLFKVLIPFDPTNLMSYTSQIRGNDYIPFCMYREKSMFGRLLGPEAYEKLMKREIEWTKDKLDEILNYLKLVSSLFVDSYE